MTTITHNSKLKNKFVVSSFLMIMTFGIAVSIFIQDILKTILEREGVSAIIVEQVITRFSTLTLGFIIFLMIVFVFTSYRLATFLTKSITTLHAVTLEIRKGNVNAKISPQLKESGDEIGELALAFEEMLVVVKQSNQELEEKINLRTKDLEEARKKEKEKNEELEKANRVMVGREIKMVELKEEIVKLKANQK